jgi:acetoin utilization deacetylase AcuC-like enzyme
LIIVSAGFDSAKGDPLGGVNVTPLGFAYMTQGLRCIQKNIAVVLEGGYSLEALEVSSEAVVRVLQTHPDDKEGYQRVLEHFGATDENNSFEKQVGLAMSCPRYSFRVTMSALGKLLKKKWGK